jgi:hypothetical protein
MGNRRDVVDRGVGWVKRCAVAPIAGMPARRNSSCWHANARFGLVFPFWSVSRLAEFAVVFGVSNRFFFFAQYGGESGRRGCDTANRGWSGNKSPAVPGSQIQEGDVFGRREGPQRPGAPTGLRVKGHLPTSQPTESRDCCAVELGGPQSRAARSCACKHSNVPVADWGRTSTGFLFHTQELGRCGIWDVPQGQFRIIGRCVIPAVTRYARGQDVCKTG